jgi:hypothetical protein
MHSASWATKESHPRDSRFHRHPHSLVDTSLSHRSVFGDSIAIWHCHRRFDRWNIRKTKCKGDILREPSNHYPNVLPIELQRASPFKKAVSPMSSESKVNRSNQNIFKRSMIGGTVLLYSVYEFLRRRFFNICSRRIPMLQPAAFAPSVAFTTECNVYLALVCHSGRIRLSFQYLCLSPPTWVCNLRPPALKAGIIPVDFCEAMDIKLVRYRAFHNAAVLDCCLPRAKRTISA